MSDGYLFGFNGTTFPLAASSAVADPVTQTILRYFQNIIQINLGTAFAADALSVGFTHANINSVIDGNMVPQVVNYPVASLLKDTNFKFPLLSVYRLTREFEQFTNMKLMIKSDYLVSFILPPLSVEQYAVLYKYLAYVSDVLIQRTWQGYDVNYNSGEQVWITAKIAYALLSKDEYGSFLGEVDKVGKVEFPGIQFRMSVMEESQFIEANYPAMQNIFVQTNAIDGYNPALPFDNIADGYVNPNLTINSLSVSSGPVAGGTIINILGAGFLNVASSQVSSFGITLNGAPVNRIVVKSNTSILIVSGPGATTGTGNVIVTDRLGNITTLTNGFTYV